MMHECDDDEVSETRGEEFSKGDIFYAVIPSWTQNDLAVPVMRRPQNNNTVIRGTVSKISGEYVITINPKAEHDLRFADHQTKAYHLSACYKDESIAQYMADRLNDIENAEPEE